MRPVLRLSVLVPLLGLSIACGETEQTCFDDRSCDTGQRCVIPSLGEAGTCGPCDATETPYNGIDDDCNGSTRDTDLDRDGENAIDAPFAPGLDCDDNDALVNSGEDEICGDAKDNDCDGTVDELDCADLSPPVLRVLSPSNGETVFGQVPLRVQADDDVGIVELRVTSNGVELAKVALQPTPSRIEEIILDTTTIPDGSVSVRIEATDLKTRVGVAMVTVQIDNRTPPVVQVLNPAEGGSYGGFFTATASVTDATGIASVQFFVDGVSRGIITSPPWQTQVDTSTLADGTYQLEVRAVDGLGNPAAQRVSFAVDNTPPNIQFVVPTDGQTIAGTVIGTVTATDASGVYEVRSGRSAGTSPLLFTVSSTAIPNGPLMLNASAEDLSIIDDGDRPGNTSSATITVTVNNIDPTPLVSFVRPANLDGVLGVTPLEVTASSLLGNPIADVTFTVEGRLAGVVNAAPYLLNYDFSTHTGTVAVVAVATDAFGNSGMDSIVVDVVPPANFRVASQQPTIGNLGAANFTTGDVTGDGVLDVVTGGGNLVVMTGTISPTTGHWSAVNPVSFGPENLLDVRLADVDGDGMDDIIGLRPDRFIVYLSQGGGVFGGGMVTTVPQAGMRAFEVADLDGDLDPDVVIVGGNTTGVVGYTYLLDLGAYTLGQVLGGDSGVSDVVLADIDADLDTDVIVGRTTTSVLTIFFNGGVGNFGAGQDTATLAPPIKVEVADINGSGTLDVIVESNGGVQIMPVITAQPFSISAGTLVGNAGGAQSFAIADVVANNLPDIVVASPGGNGMEVIQSGAQSVSGFQTDQIYVVAKNFSNVQLVDLDGDGDLDAIGTSPSNSSIVWARNLGAGDYLASISINAPRLLDANNIPVQLSPVALATGNVVGTAAPDLVVNFTGQGVPAQMVVYERAGNALTFAALAGLPPSIANPTVLDVGGASPTSGYAYIVLAENKVPQMNETTCLIIESAPPQLLSTALTVDSISDMKIGNVDDDVGSELIFALDPLGTTTDGSLGLDLDFTEQFGPLFSGSGAASIAVGNLDSDPAGQNDYAVANTGTENISVMIFGGGTAYNTTVYNAPTGLGQITTGLVNNDGFLDIVGISANGIFVMEGDPAFGFRTPQTFAAGASPRRLVGGDFNGDGLFDVMTLNNQDVAALMLARPQGGFFPPISYDMGAAPVDFLSVDFDGDGRPDVLAIQSGVPSIMFMTNNADTL